MAQHFGLLSLAPPLVAIVLALWQRRVLPALALAILTASVILSGEEWFMAPVTALDRVVMAAVAVDNFRLVLFSVLIGGLIALMREGGAFDALAAFLGRAQGRIRRRTVFGMTLVLGSTLFLETWSNILVNGTTLGALFDKLGVSRERMAYFMHTVAISTVALIPFNSWAAFYLGLLTAQQVERPFQFLLASIPFVLYCWVSLLLVLFVMASGWTIGPLRKLEQRIAPGSAAASRSSSMNELHAGASSVSKSTGGEAGGRISFLVAPLVTLIAVVLAGLTLTGHGDPRNGNGAAAVLYAVVAASVVAALVLRACNVFRSSRLEEIFISGCARFIGVAALVLLALTLGQLIKDLGTGVYVAGLFKAAIPRVLYAPLVFVVGAVISFATGTSYGTFSIMTPIAIPLAQATGADPHLLFGSCLAGGVFGDNCSPISDTTVITSIATQTDLVDHVKTQLPYALVAAAVSITGFCMLGILLD